MKLGNNYINWNFGVAFCPRKSDHAIKMLSRWALFSGAANISMLDIWGRKREIHFYSQQLEAELFLRASSFIPARSWLHPSRIHYLGGGFGSGSWSKLTSRVKIRLTKPARHSRLPFYFVNQSISTYRYGHTIATLWREYHIVYFPEYTRQTSARRMGLYFK